MCFMIMMLNLLGVHLTQLLFVYETLVLFHIAQAICNRLTYFVGLKQINLTTFIPYIPSTKKHDILTT